MTQSGHRGRNVLAFKSCRGPRRRTHATTPVHHVFGGAAVWPLAAHAQQQALPVVAFLRTGSTDTNARNVAAFRKGLNETGYVEGQNVTASAVFTGCMSALSPDQAAWRRPHVTQSGLGPLPVLFLNPI